MVRPTSHSCADILSALNMWHHFDVTFLAILFCLQCVCTFAMSINSSSFEELDYILSENSSPNESSPKDFDVEFDVDYNSGSGDVENIVNEKMKEMTLEKLSKLFGVPEKKIAKEESNRGHGLPQFMLSLYHSIADADGITRGRHPYNASVVRSFSEKDATQPLLFTFNISDMALDETVLEAEFHLYRLRVPREKHHPSVVTSPHYLLHIYQVVKDKPLSIPDAHRLLSVQYVSAYGAGWLVVNVKSAVLEWISNESSNLGFLVKATTLFGDDVEMRFARRGEHHDSQQPILVLFNTDGKKLTHISAEQDDNPLSGYPRFFTRIESDGTHVNEIMGPEEEIHKRHLHGRHNQHQHHHHHHGGRQRSRRDSEEYLSNEVTSDTNSTNSNATACSRHSMIINFTSIGWADTVISPRVYDAFHCKGECGFPLFLDYTPTNHAVLQSIVRGHNLQADVESPCCVPDVLESLTVLLQGSENQILLKTYHGMIARSCACH